MGLAVVGFDTNIFIYILERNPTFFDGASKALEATVRSGQKVCLPTLLITEILSGTSDKRVLDFFVPDTFQIYDLTREIAATAGELRFANQKLKTADAVHLATALFAGADRFVTNDQQLTGLVLGLDIQLLQDL